MKNDRLHLTGDDAMAKVRELLKHFRSALMVTRFNSDELHARPMGLLGDAAKFEGSLWFFSDESSTKTKELINDTSVSLMFQSDSNSAYMHLVVRAATVTDRAKMEELYTPLIRTWFPKGLEDPALTLIRFDADHGQFWDSPGGMLQVLAAFTKAVVTGKPGQGGEAGDLEL
jgi:general stress protein 26